MDIYGIINRLSKPKSGPSELEALTRKVNRLEKEIAILKRLSSVSITYREAQPIHHEVLDALPDTFTTKQLIAEGTKRKIGKRTVNGWIADDGVMVQKGLVERIKHGYYQKTAN